MNFHKSTKMSSVYKICISENFKGKMKSVDSIEVVAGKGLVNDRYYKNDNNNVNQITLIEKEQIDYFNKKSSISIPYISFRRNIITKDINLNELIGSELTIGKIKIKAHILCEPCNRLQRELKQDNLVKDLLHKSGLRCEILTSGKIFVGDKILNKI